jgi:hypothetical protein
MLPVLSGTAAEVQQTMMKERMDIKLPIQSIKA